MQETWFNVPVTLCKDLIKSMPRKCFAIEKREIIVTANFQSFVLTHLEFRHRFNNIGFV